MLVDLPSQNKHAVSIVLPTLGLPGVVTIDPPRPSLGTTKDRPRSCIHLHIAQSIATPIFMEVALRWLYKALRDFQAVVGYSGTMSSPSSLLMDCLTPAAGHVHGACCWSAVVISPRLVLVETRVDEPGVAR